MANEQVLSLLVNLKNDTAAGFVAMQAQIKKTQDGIDALSTASKANVGASDAMAGGQNKVKDALTSSTASASQLASVLQGDLRKAMDDATAAQFRNIESIDGQIGATKEQLATVAESQSAWDKYLQSQREVSQSVTALGSNLRTDFRSALAQATSDVLEYGDVLAGTKAKLNETEGALLEFEQAEKKASASTVQAASDATYALMRETQEALKTAAAMDAKAQSVLASVAKEEAGVAVASKGEADAFDGVTAASLRQERALLRLGGETAGVRQGFALAGVGLGGWTAILGGSAVYAAAKFQNEMQKLQGNTGANAQQMKGYTATVLDLGAKGPAALDDIATGLRHVSDLGYRGAAATTVLDAAWQGAIATGGKVNDVANALSTVLGNQHAPAAQAARDMDIIVTASQQGNLTLDQFSTNYARVGVVMSSIHQPLTDGAAAFATLSRAAGNPSIAQTWEANMLLHIIHPTGAAIKEIQLLQKSTGIDLTAAFQQFAQGSISLEQVLGTTKQAVQGNVGATEALFGGVRGGLGAVALLNNHWQDYLTTQQKVDQSNQNVQASFQKMMLTTEAQLLKLKNNVVELGTSIGNNLLPDVNDLVGSFTTAAKDLKDLNDETHGGVGEMVKMGLELYTLIKIVDLTTAAFKRLAISEIAASPVGLFAGAVVAGGEAGKALKTQEIGSENKIDAGATKQEQQYLDSLAVKWAEGKVSLKAYYQEYNLGVQEGIKNLQRLNFVQLQVLKADAQFTPKSQMLQALALDPGTTPGHKAAFTPPFDIQASMKQATSNIDDWASKVAADTRKFGEHSAQVDFDNRMLDKWKLVSANLTDEWNRLTDTSTILAAANRAAAAPILAMGRAAEAAGKGIASALATIKASEASALSAAKDIKSGVISATKGDMVPLTRSVPNDAIPYLGGTPAPSLYANSRPYGGTRQYDATVLPHGTSANAEAMSPEDRAAMAKLSNSIDQLPPQFQGAFDSVTAKFKQEEAVNYNSYLDKLNKESQHDAEVRTKIQQAHDDTVAKDNEKAQTALKAENDRYLHQIDTQETARNQALSDHLASFEVSFQSELATFEANMLADQQKAESQRQTHNDALTSDYGQLQERLAGIHGKNADQLRKDAWDAYNRQVKHDDDTYKQQVTKDDQHVKGQAKAFTDHIKGLKDTLDSANTRADNRLKSQQKTDATTHAGIVGGINNTLYNNVQSADTNQRNQDRAEAQRKAGVDSAAKTAEQKKGTTIAGQEAAASTPEAIISTLTNKKSSIYDAAYAKVTLDILEHGKATAADTVALQNAAVGKKQIQDAQDKATALATKNVYDFALAVQNTATAITNEKNTAAGYLIHPDQGNLLVPLTPSQRAANKRSQGDSGVNVATPETQSQSNWDQLLKNEKDKNAQDAANLEIDKRLAIATGDWATAAADAKTQMEKGAISVGDYVKIQQQANTQQDQLNQKYILADQGLGDFIGAAALSKDAFLKGVEGIDQYISDQQKADDQQRQQNDRQIEYDQRVGNTSEALSLITDEYHKGQRSLDELTSAYNDNQAAVAKATAQDEAFYMATGQFGQALSSLTTQIGQGVTDSQAKVTLDVYTGNTQAIDADTKSAIAHREAQDSLTAATWDATYATANAATQSQMRQSLASPMVSQQSTIQGLASGVFNAQLGVIAARSAVMVSEMQAEVTATNDLVGIVQAQSAVAKAQGDKQIAAVNDSIPIMNDQHAILVDLKNGNTLQLQIDRQQLLIDRTTAQMDQVVGQMQVTIALDGLKAAQDKMMVDQMNASAAYAVAVDNLTLAQDAVTLAEAEQQLGIDQLTVLNNIDTTLGSVTDYLNLIDSDLQNLQSAQDQQQSDQLQLANDTADQNYTNMAGQGILAGDTLGQAGDQAALQQQQQAYELQIAQYKVQLNAFQLQQADSQTNGQSVAALQAMVKTLQAMLTTVHSPAGRAIQAAGVGANSWAAVQSGWNSTQIPMGFS